MSWHCTAVLHARELFVLRMRTLAIQYPDRWGKSAIPNKENSPLCPGWGEVGANIDRCKIAERFHFHRRNQATGESIAELRRLATHYKFGGYLSEALRDMLVCGLKSESTQKRLLAETELTLAKAVEIAQSMEAADHNAQQLKGDDLRVAQVRRRHVQQRPAQAENQENPDNQRNPCYHCGGRSHAQRECRFKDVLCHNCGKKGHLAKVCLSGRQNNRRGGRVSQLYKKQNGWELPRLGEDGRNTN